MDKDREIVSFGNLNHNQIEELLPGWFAEGIIPILRRPKGTKNASSARLLARDIVGVELDRPVRIAE